MKHLTREQRYQIEAYLKCGKTKVFIAQDLGVSKSTISREIKRNASKRNKYSASYADAEASVRKERFAYNRRFGASEESSVRKYLTSEQWSPEQITGYCRSKDIPMVSHERIYQFIREDKRSGGDLYLHTRHQLKHRKRPVGKSAGPIKNRVSIDDRPDIVNSRGRFGDWEIDTIVGPENKGAIVTFVERTTGFFMMEKLRNGKEAEGLAQTVVRMLKPYKESVHTITADNGTEFAKHEMIAEKLNARVYFTHPYSSWEKGQIEYTNKLIRQYIPKKMDFDRITDKEIRDIQHKINRRPRKKLEYKSPTEIFYKLAS